MQKENEFIINLMMCRHYDESVKQVKELISDDLNWEYISYQIIMNRIAGVVLENLLFCKIVFDIPKSVLIYLFDTYTSIQHRFNNYTKELKVVSSILEKYNIQYVIVKGIHLSFTLYDHFRMNPRDFADLDIVVSKDKLKMVGEILETIGYQHARINFYNDEFDKIKRSEILNGKMFYHQIPPFEKKFEQYYIGRDSYKIDMNYTIFEGGQHEDPIPLNNLLEERVLNNVNGIQYYSLKPEHDLIQNCFHFYKDIMFEPKNKRKDVYKLINFYDIFLFINKYRNNLDYIYLLKLAKTNKKIEQALYIVLNLTERIFGSLKIESFLSQLDEDIPEYLSDVFKLDIEEIIFEKKRFIKNIISRG